MDEILLAAERRSIDLNPVADHFRCHPDFPLFEVLGKPAKADGYFRFGPDIVCYGKPTRGRVNSSPAAVLHDVSSSVQRSGDAILVPFSATQLADNLKYERYAAKTGWQARVQESWVRDVYYALRPMLPVSVRKYLQRIYLQDWSEIPFPAWPVDRTADRLLERLVAVAMRLSGIERMPFVWFWPDGHSACAILTHDVETAEGRDFCKQLMDFDDEAGIKASFQVVPEKRYTVPEEYRASIRERGFELNIHGLDHSGNLFRDRQEFLERAEKINDYADQYGALGFRSPVLYRNIDWFQDLRFSYDMSVPNVGRLEPQRGGCCTVMPYFLPGGMTELPLTTTEDYSLFHVLGDYSTTVWAKQIKMILQSHGMMSFLVHPDYVTSGAAQDTYKQLLAAITILRSDRNVWIPLPREVDLWWRQRSAMNLVWAGKTWKVEGPGSERAHVAHAVLDGDRLGYEL